MPCEPFQGPNGAHGFICSRGRTRKTKRCHQPGCGMAADFLCDGKLDNGKSCDAPICRLHRTNLRANVDICLPCLSRLSVAKTPLFQGDGMEFTLEQRAAIETNEPRVAIVGGAGTGKTSVLVARAVRLMHEGVAPSSILLAPFTETAAAALRAQLERDTGFLPKDLPQVATLAGWAFDQMQAHPEWFGLEPWFDVFDALDRDTILQAIQAEGLRARGKPPQLWEVTTRYEQRLGAQNAEDIDNLLPRLTLALQGDHGAALRATCRYVLVDEAQDLTPAQHELLEAMRPVQIVLAGDPRQAIFGWRGASAGAFDKFTRLSIPRWITINQRNGANVVALSNAVYRSSPYPEQRAQRPTDDLVQRLAQPDLSAVVAAVRQHLSAGIEPREVAVLARTWRRLESVRAVLKAAEIPASYYGPNLSPWESPVGRDLARWLRLCRNSWADDLAALLLRSLWKLDTAEMRREARERGDLLLKFAVWLDRLPEPLPPEASTREQAERLFSHPCAQALRESKAAQWLLDQLEHPRRATPAAFLRWWLLQRTPQDAVEFGRPDAVQLTTICGAKEQSWRAVVLIDTDQKEFPGHPRRPTEERNLLYVAVTRARERLTLLCAPDSPPSHYLTAEARP